MSNYVESYVTSRRSELPNTETAITHDLIPEQQREDADILIRLLEDYYRHLNSEGLPSYEINSILQESDIDSASNDFIERIQSEIAKTFPTSLQFDKVSFYKKVVQYYSSRGTEDSALVFFKLFFDETAEIFYPKDNLFKLSQGRWNIDKNALEPYVQGILTNSFTLSENNIGATLDFVNRPALSHESVLYINPADEDSHIRGSEYANDLSGKGNNVEFRYDTNVLVDPNASYNAVTNPYVTTVTTPDFNYSEKAYEYSNAKRKFGIITNLNYGGSVENRLPEMSAFCWVKNLHGNPGTEGVWGNNNWALIDFDRSDVFSLWINSDGYLAFAGNASNEDSIGTNLTGSAASGVFDIAANGKAYDHSTSAIAGSFYGKTHKYNLGDTDWHYVGVTYSSTRIILWVDGEAAQVFTPNSGTLGALGQGARRFGIIGDGSESGAGDDGGYGNPSTNRHWFTGSIAGTHLHETEICSDDSTIAAGDTNANVTANMNATRPFTMTGNEAAGTGYPTRYKAQISRYELVDTEINLASEVDLDNSLKAYYNFGISDSYTIGATTLFDISTYQNAHSSVICNFCSHGANYIQFGPTTAANPSMVDDRIVNRSVSGTLSSTEQVTLVSWIKKNNYVDANGGDLTYGMIAKLEDYVGEKKIEMMLDQTDGSIGFFKAQSNTTYQGLTSSKATKIYHSSLANFSITNKIVDNEWHMVAMKIDGRSNQNGSVAISLDGGAFETIWSGGSSNDGDFLNWTPDENTHFTIGNAQILTNGIASQAAGSYSNVDVVDQVVVSGSTNANYNGTYVYDSTEEIWYNNTNTSATDGSKGYFYFNSSANRWQFGSTSGYAKSTANAAANAQLNPSPLESQGFWLVDENTNWQPGNANITSIALGLSFEESSSSASLPDSRSTHFPFSGNINSASIYQKQLSDSEVLALYNSTKANTENYIVTSLSEGISGKYNIYYSGATHSQVTSVSPTYINLLGVESSTRLISPTFNASITPTDGNYLNQKGFASSINKLQDSNYWQNFSYEVRSGVSSSKWLNEFLNLVHPAGLKLFAALVLKIYNNNEWDRHLINRYYSIKQRLVEDSSSASLLREKERLEKTIGKLYRIDPDKDYLSDFSWIRETAIDSNATGYGIPTYQPGYLYKEFATIQFLVEALLTPSENGITEEERYWINFGKNYISHVILKILHESTENVHDRAFESYALGQLKFSDVTGSKQYLNYTLDKGALNTEINLGLSDSDGNPLQELTFTALPPQVRSLGTLAMFPYIRATLSGASSSSSSSNNDYVLSSYEADGDGTTYDNSSIDPELEDLGIQV